MKSVPNSEPELDQFLTMLSPVRIFMFFFVIRTEIRTRPIFHGFETSPNFDEFFDEANLNPYRPESGPWNEPLNVGSKIVLLKSEPRTKFRTGF